uniref:Uncharacterized protein n=1 Tax=Setaria italica TaxID=4555 RepID=K3YBD4_SETIT
MHTMVYGGLLFELKSSSRAGSDWFIDFAGGEGRWCVAAGWQWPGGAQPGRGSDEHASGRTDGAWRRRFRRGRR